MGRSINSNSSPSGMAWEVDDDDLTVHGDDVITAVAPLLDLLRDGVSVVIRGRHFNAGKGLLGATEGCAMIAFCGEVMTGVSASAAIAQAAARP